MTPTAIPPEFESAWMREGWCVRRDAIPAAGIQATDKALSKLFPSADEMDAGTDDERTAKWRDWDAAWPEFPFRCRSLNFIDYADLYDEPGEAIGPAGSVVYHAWPFKGLSPDWHNFVQHSNPRELTLLGFPEPGHPYWNAETLAGVGSRYPGLDMDPWAAALR